MLQPKYDCVIKFDDSLNTVDIYTSPELKQRIQTFIDDYIVGEWYGGTLRINKLYDVRDILQPIGKYGRAFGYTILAENADFFAHEKFLLSGELDNPTE